MKKLTFLLLLLCFNITFSQNGVENSYFSIVISSGTAINNPYGAYFYYEDEYKPIKPGIYGSFGIEYGPLNILESTQLFFSTSIGYTKVSTSEIELEYYPSTAQLFIESIPVLFWGRLQTNTKLSPFVEIGIGLSKLKYLETYSNERVQGASFNYWALGLGFGAGLNYRLSQSYEIALVVQQLSNEKEKIVVNDRGHRMGITVRNIVIPITLRISIKL